MEPNPLSPTALIRVFDRLRPLLGKADAQRLDQLHPLMSPDGRINQAQLLSTLFPAKSPRDSLTALRQFRERINAAAKDGDMVLEFHQDGQTKAPATQRSVFFTGDDLAARGAEALTDESTSDIPARIASGELRQDQQAMPADAMEVATVISYGHDDKSLMLDLLGRLKRLFAQSNRYRFKIWFDERLLLGKPFDPPIRDRFRHCHLGLLMLSPDFAKSDYIRDLEFPHFLLGDALGGGERHPVPIGLRPVQLSDHAHLRRLKPSLVFYGDRKRCYEECKGERARDAFAAALFTKIEKLLEHHPPPVAGPPPRDTLVERDIAERLAEQRLPHVAATRGRPGGMAEAPRENAGTQDALDFLQAWLNDPAGQPYAALLGEYGMGKTTSCRIFARRLLEARRSGEQAPLPIYLDLRDLKSASRESGKLDTILEALLERANRHDTRNPLTPAELRRLVQDEGALLIIDGLDEALTHLATNDGHMFTRQLLECLPLRVVRNRPADRPGRPGRLLVSCRTHFFPTLRAQASHFTVQGREGLHTEDFRALTLLPFEEDQILDYLRACLPERDPTEVLALFRSVHNLAELAERPVTLAMLAERIERIEKLRAERGALTGAELYRELILSWLDRDDGKHQIDPSHKQLLMEEIAARLWREGSAGWSGEEAEEWLVLTLRERPNLAAHYEGIRRELLKLDLRNATCLVRAGDSFRFAHTSLQEYFLAAHLLRALREKRPEGWALPPVSRETLDFLGQMLMREPAAVSGLALLRDTYRAGASELLLAYALRALQAGYPCVPLAGLRLEGAQLARIDIIGPEDGPPLNMAGACFCGSVLREAVFRRVNLDGADFSGAALLRAEFQDCRMDKVKFDGAGLEGALFPGTKLAGASFEGVRWARTRLFGNAAMAPAPASFAARNAQPGRAWPAWLDGHDGWVTSVSFSPDGARILSGSWDRTLRLWDAASGAPLATLSGHEDGVLAVGFSPDSARLVSGSYDGTLRLWDAANFALLTTLRGHEGGVNCVGFSPDGARLVSGSADDGTLRLWDADSGALLTTLTADEDGVNSASFSPDGKRLVSGSDDRTLRLWDAASGALLATLKGHEGPVTSVCFSPDSMRLVSASDDGTLRLWDTVNFALLAALTEHEGGVNSVGFSPDGACLVSGADDGTLRLWDAASGASLATLKGHQGPVHSVGFSPDGAYVVSGSEDTTLRLWDATKGAMLATLKGHERGVSSVGFSPDGKRLVSGSEDGTLWLWDAIGGAQIATLTGHEDRVTSVGFSPDGARLVSGSWDRTLRLWDAASGALLATLMGHRREVTSVGFSPDGARLVSGSDDGTLRLWDATNFALLGTLKKHRRGVLSVGFSPDGRRLVSGSWDRTLRLWDAVSGALLATLKGHEGWVTSVGFSPDGARLVSGSEDGALRLWDAASGALLATLTGHQGWVRSVGFSPDGARLVSGADEGTIRLWEATNGAPLAQLPGHADWVRSVGFSPDGARLVSASHDGTLRLWDAASFAPLMRVHLAGDAIARFDGAGRLLGQQGEAWRYLHWHRYDEAGRLETWPFECFAPPPLPEPPAARGD